MNQLTIKSFILLLTSILSIQISHAQLTVADTLNANELAQYFIGLNLSISNVTLNCAASASGTFEGSTTNIGLDTGIILTTGSIANAVGPNNLGASSVNNGQPGDPDLDALVQGVGTNDACVLEFDLVPNSTVLYFRYVFASEEYPEFVNSFFNDVFGFFISGPGITGVQNIAQVPGTTIPVAINNVNNGTGNCTPTGPNGPCTNCAFYVDNCQGASIEYDGFTTVITASIGNLVPTGTYHLKLAIADAGDFVFDSGVFLEAATNDTSKISCKPPNNLQTTFLTSNKVKLAWDPVPGATQYLVRGNELGGNGFVFEQAAFGANSVIVENLSYNKSYFWQVQCICESNFDFPSSPFTQSQTFTTGSVCERPVNLSVNVQPTNALLSWDAVAGAASYVIRGRAAGSNNIVTIDGITSNSYSVSNLQPGVSYEWVVKTICSGQNSSSRFSEVNAFTTEAVGAKSQDARLLNIDLSTAKVFPNPARDVIYIQLPTFESELPLQAQLYNFEGRLVLSELLSGLSNLHQIAVPASLQGGIYTLQVASEGAAKHFKVALVR